MIAAALRLFKAVPLNLFIEHASEAGDTRVSHVDSSSLNPESVRLTVPCGYLLDPRIVPSTELLDAANDVVGLTGDQANATFHKSWEKVQSAKIEQLVIEQVMHYFTTYGFEALGVYDPSTVYIPNEKLEVPGLEEDLSLTYVKGLTSDELLQAIVQLGSGVALNERTLDDVMEIVETFVFEPAFLKRIKNFELLTRLYVFYGLVPEEPVAFLRYLVYQVTGKSLLIKNQELIEQIKAAADHSGKLDELIPKAPEDLASIFYRFKPLFLALKSISQNKHFFNRLRKLAIKKHQPLRSDYLNSVTTQIKRRTLDLREFKSRICHASVYRRIRLAYALQFRLNANKSVLYTIRNGTGWATDFDWPEELNQRTKEVRDVVVNSLIEDLRKNVSGKKCFIPDFMSYALPSSEKQFAGAFPTGSYVETKGPTVFGVHWYNTQTRRIDLDLSLLSAAGKIGWDAQYRSDEALFSGDMTDAPRPIGATELFYVKKGIAAHLVMCNYFNFSAADPVDAQIIVARDAPKKLSLNYMVDINKIVAKADLKIARKQIVVGLVITAEEQTRFYFGNVSVGHGFTASPRPYASHTREFLADRFMNGLDLRSMLELAGAEVVNAKTEDPDLIDLSPDNLTKSDLIALFQPNQEAHSVEGS